LYHRLNLAASSGSRGRPRPPLSRRTRSLRALGPHPSFRVSRHQADVHLYPRPSPRRQSLSRGLRRTRLMPPACRHRPAVASSPHKRPLDGSCRPGLMQPACSALDSAIGVAQLPPLLHVYLMPDVAPPPSGASYTHVSSDGCCCAPLSRFGRRRHRTSFSPAAAEAQDLLDHDDLASPLHSSYRRRGSLE
jgi:hypothetical protein